MAKGHEVGSQVTGQLHKVVPKVRVRWKFQLSNLRAWPVFPAVILAAVLTCAVFAPWIAPHDPIDAVPLHRLTGPAWYAEGTSRYVLGTDQQGRDVLSRVIYGSRVSLTIAAFALGAGGAVGTLLGMVAGYKGGWIDEFIMRTVDVTLSIPIVLVALVIVVVAGQKFSILVVILAVNLSSTFARQVRAETLQLKTMDYVALAKLSGASSVRILLRHIMPGLTNTVIVIGTLGVGTVILTEAILSFLGAGIPPPTPVWGSMIADGRTYLASAWWVAFFPGAAIFLSVLAFNFLGDWLRDRFDPVLRQSMR